MGENNNFPNDNNEFGMNQVPDTSQEPEVREAFKDPFDNQYESSPTQNPDSAYEQTFETTGGGNNKKSGKKLIAFILAAVILVAGSITAYANRASLSNTIALMTKSPLEYYSSIEKKALNHGIDSFTENYDKSLTQYKEIKEKGAAQDIDVKVKVSPEFSSMAGLGDLKTIEAKISSLTKDGNSKSTIGLSYGDKSLATLDGYLNKESNQLYLKVPELSSAYLLFSMDELMQDYGTLPSTYSYQDYIKDIESVINNESLSPDILNSLLKKYSAIIVDNIDNAKLDKKASVKASDVESTYIKVTSEINGEDAYNMAMAVLEEAKKDDTLKDLFVSLKICTEAEYEQKVETAITDLKDSKESMTAEKEPVTMLVYINNSGKIMGREFKFKNEDNNGEAGYYITNAGSKIGFSGWISENDKKVMELTGSGTYSKDGFNGKADFSLSQENAAYGDTSTYSFTVGIENAKFINDRGYLNGKFTVTSDLLMGMELSFDCKAQEKQQDILFNLKYANLDAVTVDLLYKEGSYSDFEFPSSSEQVFDAVKEIDSYAETVDIDGFTKKLEDALGIEDLQGLISNYFYNSMY